MAKAKAGHIIGIVGVLGVGYLAYKNGAFASVSRIFKGNAIVPGPINVPASVKLNAVNDALLDQLNKVETAANGVALGKVLALTPPPLVTLAPPETPSTPTWSPHDGNLDSLEHNEI